LGEGEWAVDGEASDKKREPSTPFVVSKDARGFSAVNSNDPECGKKEGNLGAESFGGDLRTKD